MDQARRPWDELHEAVDHEAPLEVMEVLESLPTHDLPRTFAKMEPHDSVHLLEIVSGYQAAAILGQLPDAQAADLVENLKVEDAVAILGNLSTRDQADLFEELETEEASHLLAAMDRGTAASIREIVSRVHGSAGAILDPEILAFDQSSTIAEVVGELQQNGDRYREFQVLYVHTTHQGKLTGVVRMRDLLMHPPTSRLTELVLPTLVTLSVDAPLEDVEAAFEHNEYLGLPVVDGEGHVLGVVSRSAMEHAVALRSESDYRASQGIVGGEELRSMPVSVRAKRRLSWLSVNIVLNIIAASVIAAYEETLAAVIALAAFLPIISDMSGCSGNQAVAVSMRELALGVATPKDVMSVWRKEVVVALINGVVLGVLVGVVAFAWRQNLFLSLVVGIALALNTVIAVSLGGVVPLILKRFKVDPAVASGPILTTITDLCGFLITLSLATMWLSQIAT